jgi:hypothetical protein
MAHTLGNNSTRANSASTTITTATFTPDSGVTCLVLKLWVLSATSRAGGAPTYNGVTMQQAGTTQKAAASPEVSVEIWYLTGASAAVAATASIPNSGALTIHYTFCTGKAGSGKTSVYDNAVGSNGTSTNPTCTAFTMAANSIGFALVGTGLQTVSGSVTPSHTVLEAVFDAGATGGASQYHINNAGGSVTFSWTAGSDDWGGAAVSFKEVNAYSLSCDPGAYTVTGSNATLTATVATLTVQIRDSVYGLIRQEVYTPGTLATSTIALTTPERDNVTSWPPFIRLIKANSQIDVAEVWFDAPPSAGSPTLSTDIGTYAVTGSDATLVVGRVLSTDAGSHTVTGSDVTFVRGFGLSVDAGSYAVTGSDATLSQPARALEAAAGSYAVTGADATFARGFSLSADAGSYTSTGADASFRRGYAVTGDAGAYAVTGSDATLHEQATLTVRIMDGATLIREEMLTPSTLATSPVELTTLERDAVTSWPPLVRLIKTNAQIDVAEVWFDAPPSAGYTLTVDAGSYAVTGSNATLTYTTAGITGTGDLTAPAAEGEGEGTVGSTAYSLTCDAGSYAVTGSNATLTFGHVVSAVAGSYAVTGSDASLRVSHVVITESGAYAVTGSAASTAFGRSLTGDAGSYAVTGSDATFRRGYVLTVDAGAYALTGAIADLLKTGASQLTAESGVYAITGSDALLQLARILSANPGSYSVTGADATLVLGRAVIADAGAYAVAGSDATLNRTEARSLTAEPGAYAVTGSAATLNKTGALSFTGDAGAYSVTGADATLRHHHVLVAESGSYALTGSDVTALRALVLQAGTGAYVITGASPTLDFSGFVLHGVNPSRTIRVPAKLDVRVSPRRSLQS